jgi:hypothetical protein
MAVNSEKHTNAMFAYRKRMEKKQMTSEINAEERGKRSPKAQIDLLDKRLGKGIGAVKERARLNAQIEAAKAPKAEAPAPVAAEKKGKAAKK